MARHIVMGQQEQRILRVPSLTGGINTKDYLGAINDNQLADGLNVWWNNGCLKTRPGTSAETVETHIQTETKVKPKQTDILIGGYRLCFYPSTSNGTSFWMQKAKQCIVLPKIQNYVASFVVQKGKTIYAFLGKGANKIFKNDVYLEGEEIKYGSWAEVNERDIYVPLVYTNCLTDGIGETFSGVQLEGHSLLTPWFKMKYSNVNRSLLKASDPESKHLAVYNVPFAGNKNIYSKLNEFLVVKHTTSDGSIVEHKVDKLENNIWLETTTKSDLKNIQVYKNTDGSISLRFGALDSIGFTIDDLTSSDFIEDNIEIEVKQYVENFETEKNKVFNMTQTIWYGGDAAGLSSGTRLFLCGNTSEKEKSLVLWSGLNDPLYFSENCYAYVGNERQAVTCFGKQGGTLIIFKENGAGCYYTQYVKSDSITASDLISQSVVDYAASSVYFPIIALHPTIGCDCPDTVQLCRNRLVWACSTGDVYTLTNQSQNSERNIYKVSEMISKKLSKEANIKTAHSADWRGHYLLFTDNKVYVMDYESYGYAYISSHTKTEDAQSKIPWWYWEFKNSCQTSIVLDDKLIAVFSKNETNGSLFASEISTDFKNDANQPIRSELQTKLFDFGISNFKKNVQSVYISFGKNNCKPIKVRFVTEFGEEEQEVLIESENVEERDAGYFCGETLLPCIKSVKRFGIKLSCDGEISTDTMLLKYIVTGGAR